MSKTREAIDSDLEFLYKQCKAMRHKMLTDAQEDDYVSKVRELVVNHKMSDIAARIKAFNEVML